MPAYLERMPAGFAGSVSRYASATLEANFVGNTPIAFGQFVKIKTGKVEALGAGDTAGSIYGLLVRSFPTQSISNEFGTALAAAGTAQDILRRGYMTVTLKGAAAATKAGQVYVYITANAGKVAGDIVAVADGSNTLAVPNCVFMGSADTNGNVEIAYNI